MGCAHCPPDRNPTRNAGFFMYSIWLNSKSYQYENVIVVVNREMCDMEHINIIFDSYICFVGDLAYFLFHSNFPSLTPKV